MISHRNTGGMTIVLVITICIYYIILSCDLIAPLFVEAFTIVYIGCFISFLSFLRTIITYSTFLGRQIQLPAMILSHLLLMPLIDPACVINSHYNGRSVISYLFNVHVIFHRDTESN